MRPAAEYFADQPRIVEHDRWLVEQPHDGYAAAAFAVLRDDLPRAVELEEEVQ